LAVAIIIHNIPEGICVALPIYYATGNRFKAFCWGMMSGLSEIIAALLAWAILAPIVNDTVFGVMYSLVAGIMVVTAITELLPPALRYDPENSVTSTAFIVGMTVMALSLVLLTS
jgi:zinc transporter, ZIP family